MQKYMYEKAMAQETRNGGTSTLNNNNGVDNSKKKLLIALDIICLLLGKFIHKFRLNIPPCYNLKCLLFGHTSADWTGGIIQTLYVLYSH